nr:hypothetical protein Iba_chr02eCG6980 [Ipomoea batatas]
MLLAAYHGRGRADRHYCPPPPPLPGCVVGLPSQLTIDRGERDQRVKASSPQRHPPPLLYSKLAKERGRGCCPTLPIVAGENGDRRGALPELETATVGCFASDYAVVADKPEKVREEAVGGEGLLFLDKGMERRETGENRETVMKKDFGC